MQVRARSRATANPWSTFNPSPNTSPNPYPDPNQAPIGLRASARLTLCVDRPGQRGNFPVRDVENFKAKTLTLPLTLTLP